MSKQLAQIAQETLQILAAGRYRAPSGRWVQIADDLHHAVEGTVAYPPDVVIPWSQSGNRSTQIEVERQSTLAAARALVAQGYRPAALNFASGTHPGGGFRVGAQAQEESLARASGLFTCIEGQPMYEHHRQLGDPMYSSYAVYSPDVPFFRDDAGSLLEEPFRAAVISCAAPNFGHMDPSREPELEGAFQERIARVLAIGLAHGHDAIVLGAWGCGAFRNDPVLVAGLFREALTGEYRDAYERVVFALTGRSRDHVNLQVFEKTFRSLR